MGNPVGGQVIPHPGHDESRGYAHPICRIMALCSSIREHDPVLGGDIEA